MVHVSRFCVKVALVAVLVAALVATGAGTADAQGEAPRRNGLGVAFNHVSLEVAEFDRELAFWTMLGGSSRTVGDGGFAIVTFPDMNVTVRRGQGTGGTEGSLIGHIGFQVPDIQAGETRFRAAGLTVEAGGFPGQRWLTSPSGVRVEILQDPNLTQPIRGHHVHFFNTEPLKMQAWYAGVFGAAPGKRGNFDAADITAATTTMNLTFGGADAATQATKGRALDHVAFSVTNLEAFMKRLEALDVRVDQPYTLQPNGTTALAFVIDPWGTRIELIDQQAGGQ